LVPLAIKTQSIWFTQRELRTRILAIDFKHEQRSRTETRDLLLRLQELRFELHVWHSEIEAYHSSLLPWQARVFARYLTSWRVEDNHTRLTTLVDHAYDLLRSTAERFDSMLEARQANILAIIAIMQLIGTGGAIAGYFDLAGIAQVDIKPIAQTQVFVGFVALLPAITAIAILGLIVAARRRR